jgi:hypothetical protein
LFVLYIDPLTKKADIKDIITTAKTLGLDTKYKIVYEALILIADDFTD